MIQRKREGERKINSRIQRTKRRRERSTERSNFF